METIRRSDKIYAWAHEYHVMGFGTFKRGWCLMELGVTKARPILYSYSDGLHDDAGDVYIILLREDEGEERAGLQQLFRFEAAGFSVESDRDVRSKTGPRILVFGFVAQHRFHFHSRPS